MKNLLFFLSMTLCFFCSGQGRLNPVIKSFGGIYDVPEATVLPDPDLDYNIVVDVKSGTIDPQELAPGIYNVARMINLLAVGGADVDRLNVVLAIHASATYAILNNDEFKERFDTDNPNIPLIEELKKTGVKVIVCGQSLKGRGVEATQVLPQVEIATSMLTTVATYQLKGYAFFQF